MEFSLEIERKWLLRELPRLSWKEVLAVRQGYLSQAGHKLRIRYTRRSDQQVVCFVGRKTGQGMTRQELEIPISQEAFELLWPLAEGRRLEKTRYLYVGPDGLTWEIDQYHDRLASLVTAEVELTHEEQPVVIPDEIRAVLVREVTGERPYLNASLAKHGLPERH
ncbi:MAG: hypothetical protein JW797_19060 [Bradymonadales bacterium]|nr:hypothetical protein [Bradymonadales bacterium]